MAGRTHNKLVKYILEKVYRGNEKEAFERDNLGDRVWYSRSWFWKTGEDTHNLGRNLQEAMNGLDRLCKEREC